MEEFCAMSDQLVRAISKDGFVKAVAVSTRDLTERARQIHHTLPVATAALGRTLAAASMMGNALKGDGASVTLQVKGGGPLGTILAVSDNEGNVRGTVDNPAVDIPLRPDGKLDVGSAVGCDGTLTVIRDLNMKEPYVGSVGLLGGEIAEDLAAYFVESEQIPTACGLGVLVDRDQSVLAAGGYLIQLLPGAGEDVISKVEGGVMAAGSVTGMLQAGDGRRCCAVCCQILTWRSWRRLPWNTAATAAGTGWNGPSSAWAPSSWKALSKSKAARSSPASSATMCRPLHVNSWKRCCRI